MGKSEMIKWLQNLKKDMGQTQHQDLWHYAEMLDEVIDAIEVSEDCSDNYKGYCARFEDGCFHQCKDASSVLPQQKEGEWIPDPDGGFSCSNCRAKEDEFIYGTGMRYVNGESEFCPNCGAKMKG